MTRERLLALLDAVAAGKARPREVLGQLAWMPYEVVADGGTAVGGMDGDAGAGGPAWARIDHHRALRQGYPEVVLGEGKTPEQVLEICRRIAGREDGFLATRLDRSARSLIASEFPDAAVNPVSRTAHLTGRAPLRIAGAAPVLVVSAGTGDVPVAEEAAVTAGALGNPVDRLYDVGVAGLHRLLQESTALRSAGVVIVVAGMEGALPSVVGGLLPVPVIAVPTSVGYGAAFDGLAALLGMLSSCAAGVTVVNIDNGFGAGYAAARINLLLHERSGHD